LTTPPTGSTPATAHIEAKALRSLAPPLTATPRERLRGLRAAVAVGTIVMAPTCMVLQPSLGHAQTLPSEMSGNPNEVLGFEQMRVPRWLAETVVRGEHAKSWGELPEMPMITCAERLAGFTTDVDPAPESLVEVLCENHVGTYLLPFLCRLAPEGFRNARTGELIEGRVGGWREPKPSSRR
jgi:hypothetical protein